MVGSGLALQWKEGMNPMQPMKALLVLVLIAAASLLLIESFSDVIILTNESIEVRRLFSRRVLPFEKVRGRSEFVVRGTTGTTRYLRLEPNDAHFPALEFEKAFNFDDAFYAWFETLPKLHGAQNG